MNCVIAIKFEEIFNSNYTEIPTKINISNVIIHKEFPNNYRNNFVD